MDFTDKVYDSNKLTQIKDFEKKYGVIKDVEFYKSLLSIKKELIDMRKTYEKDEFKKFLADHHFSSLAKLLNEDYSPSSFKNLNDEERYNIRNEAKKDLINVLNIIKQFGETTMDYIYRKHFNLTAAEIAVQLDMEENYITRNIKDSMDYFTINNYSRYYIKTESKVDTDYINKKIFVQFDTYCAFIKKYIKYSAYFKKFEVILEPTEQSKLLDKFKQVRVVNKGIKQAIEVLQSEYINSNKTKKTYKDENDLFELTEEMMNDILFNDDIVVESRKTLKQRLKQEAYAEMMNKNAEKEYTVKSYNDAQLERVLRLTDHARLVFSGIDKNIAAKGVEPVMQRKILIRYMITGSVLGIGDKIKNSRQYDAIFQNVFEALEEEFKVNNDNCSSLDRYISLKLYKIMMRTTFTVDIKEKDK